MCEINRVYFQSTERQFTTGSVQNPRCLPCADCFCPDRRPLTYLFADYVWQQQCECLVRGCAFWEFSPFLAAIQSWGRGCKINVFILMLFAADRKLFRMATPLLKVHSFPAELRTGNRGAALGCLQYAKFCIDFASPKWGFVKWNAGNAWSLALYAQL